MIKLVLMLVVLALYSCGELPEVNVDKKKTTYILNNYYKPLEIVIIDSCEYLYVSDGYFTMLTHKGNCKNCKTK
jgi:hypothetical protein